MTPRPVAVTGAGGRVGSALVAALRRARREVVPWSRPDYDLDDPSAAARVVERDRPALVYHAAAWTDTDACARDPERARRRNTVAAAELAAAAAAAGASFVLISTNEVFSGERDDGLGYAESDAPAPMNEYARSKLAGEDEVRAAYAARPEHAWIVRTSWIFGPPGNDFPARIAAAARRVPAGEQLRVVSDEFGRPTFAPDLAAALMDVPHRSPDGTLHVANAGTASRLEWTRAVLKRCGIRVAITPVHLAQFDRPSRPPRWGVLDTRLAESRGIHLRPWSEALADYLAGGCPD